MFDVFAVSIAIIVDSILVMCSELFGLASCLASCKPHFHNVYVCSEQQTLCPLVCPTMIFWMPYFSLWASTIALWIYHPMHMFFFCDPEWLMLLLAIHAHPCCLASQAQNRQLGCLSADWTHDQVCLLQVRSNQPPPRLGCLVFFNHCDIPFATWHLFQSMVG